MNQRYVLTTVKLKDLLSLFVIGLRKVQTQNLLFTFTWNVKRAQNNFVPIFNSKVGVRLIHECDLYSSKYGNWHKCCLYKFLIWPISMVSMVTIYFLNSFGYIYKSKKLQNFKRLPVVEILVALNFNNCSSHAVSITSNSVTLIEAIFMNLSVDIFIITNTRLYGNNLQPKKIV